MDKENLIYFPLSDLEITLVLLSLLHNVKIVSAPTSIKALIEYFEKLSKQTPTPFDTHIELTEDSAFYIDTSLHSMMFNSVMAKKFGGSAEETIGTIHISELAEHIPLMRDILRRVENCIKMAEFECRISNLEKTN